MHDLIFGNITWSMGFNVTHADGFYSQTPMYYASMEDLVGCFIGKHI